MEIEEEHKTKSSSWIPIDVTIEILLRLPGKSVVRFRCVSKLWSSITTTPHFIKSFSIHSLARPSLLLVKKEDDKRVFFSLPHHQDPQRCYTRVESYEMILPKQESKLVDGKIFSSIRGLICFGDGDQVIIWNPTLRQHVVLPHPGLSKPLITFLGYDPIEDKYKVLCMSGNMYEKPRVITLGAQETWRPTKDFSSGHSQGINRCVYGGICMNGILYYYRDDYDILESFDVRSEEFKQIKMPNDVKSDTILHGSHVITSYHGRLAWLHYDGFRAWFLKDTEKQEWSDGIYSFPDPSSVPRMDGPYQDRYLQLGGMTDYEEIICMHEPKKRPFYIFYHDFKKNTTRAVGYEGLKAEYDTDCDRFPNHVENLMSLKNLF